MIRRILVFLAVLFVGFFVWRWYDRAAADALLVKIKNLSVKKEDTYTTTLTNPDGSTTVINNNELGSSGLMTIITDTMSDKTASGSEVNDGLLQQILTSDNLKNTAVQSTGVVYVTGVTGGVITNTGKIETISAQPPTTSASTQPRVVTPSQQQPSSTLSDEDKSELEKFMSNWF